jgi:NAD-dependent SIR2 family protein deacetylase
MQHEDEARRSSSEPTAPSGGDPSPVPEAAARLSEFLRRHRRLFVLTGAGISTESGIPDYRDAAGNWKRPQPVQYGEFVRSERVRRRYWARSLVGWRSFRSAEPGRAHHALARLEQHGWVRDVVTQNVDGLHQRAGSRRVIDLHGRLDRVGCLQCGGAMSREAFQQTLETLNPDFCALDAPTAPDGDADLDARELDGFRVPACARCGGTLKPAVVFFGESVPRAWVDDAFRRLKAADALLVVGSSLMVWSGFRFCREAARRGAPIAAVNLGRTRADDLLTLKIEADCGRALAAAAESLGGPRMGRASPG